MKCPTCGSVLYLIRATRVKETITLAEDDTAEDVIDAYILSAVDVELWCFNGHSWGCVSDDDEHYSIAPDELKSSS